MTPPKRNWTHFSLPGFFAPGNRGLKPGNACQKYSPHEKARKRSDTLSGEALPMKMHLFRTFRKRDPRQNDLSHEKTAFSLAQKFPGAKNSFFPSGNKTR